MLIGTRVPLSRWCTRRSYLSARYPPKCCRWKLKSGKSKPGNIMQSRTAWSLYSLHSSEWSSICTDTGSNAVWDHLLLLIIIGFSVFSFDSYDHWTRFQHDNAGMLVVLLIRHYSYLLDRIWLHYICRFRLGHNSFRDPFPEDTWNRFWTCLLLFEPWHCYFSDHRKYDSW